MGIALKIAPSTKVIRLIRSVLFKQIFVALMSLAVALSSASLIAQSSELWRDYPPGSESRGLAAKSAEGGQTTLNVSADSFRRMTLDLPLLSSQLSPLQSSEEGGAAGGLEGFGEDSGARQVSISIPLPDGSFASYRFETVRVLAEDLARKYPQIQTYKAVDSADATNTGRFDFGPLGFHGLLIHDGREILIDPELRGNTEQYLAYYAQDARALSAHPGDNYREIERQVALAKPSVLSAKTSTGEQLRTFRLAVSATGEYTQFHGGSVANGLAAIATVINRVNQIFIRDLAIQFELVANNDALIYTNANTDPFENSDEDVETNAQVQSSVIGNNNFDLGHVFNTGGGGLAYNGLCDNTYKARGLSGSGSPSGDLFYVDIVAHELGHQLGGSHTFNGTENSCEGNREASTAWEPGSGSSIMAYSGICGSQDLQFRADPFFHSSSIEQMMDFVESKEGGACGSLSSLSNAPPVADAGQDYTVPANTPLLLQGDGSDSDGDTLAFSWDSFDLGTASSSPSTMIDDGSRPLFRFFEPNSSENRYLPRLSDVVDGSTILGESYATTNRDLNFRFSVRDGQGGVAYDDMRVIVTNSAGPLRVIEPSSGAFWTSGDSETLTWDVANTDLAPINCSQVDILLSSDGGVNFNIELLSNTANDGESQVTVPAVSSDRVRVMLRCSDNIFFALSEANTEIENTQNNTAPVAVNDTATLEENSGQNLIDVLANDTDAESLLGDFITLIDIVYSGSGTVEIVSGQIAYTPGTNFSGTETLSYTIADSANAQASASLTITVQGQVQTTAPVSSGGGGGGGSFSNLSILVFISIILLSGCQASSKNPASESGKGPISSEGDTSSKGDTSPGDEVASLAEPVDKIARDVNAALAKDDRRLLMFSGRNPTLPGTKIADFEYLKKLCGVRIVVGSGDHLRDKKQGEERRALLVYAQKYNKVMSEYCKTESP